MGQNTRKIATIYAGHGVELHIVVDLNAPLDKRIVLFKKWYQYNDENDFGYHRHKVTTFDNYGDALQYVTHIVRGFIKV